MILFRLSWIRLIHAVKGVIMSSKKENPHHIINRPFEAYKGQDPYIFISYAHKDSELVYPEITRLYELGYHVWYDEGIELSLEWCEEVENALQKSAYFIVFISPNAVESKNVRNEINLALDENKKFLAIYLDQTQLKYGLKLQIGTIQSLLKYSETPEVYMKKLSETLPDEVLGEPPIKHTTENKAIDAEAEFTRLVREGQELKDRGDYNGAAVNFREALRYNPDDALVWHRIGDICEEQGKHDAAIKCYSRAIKIDNNHVAALYGKGTCLYNLEKYDEALDCLVKVLAINPRHKKAADKKQALEKIIESQTIEFTVAGPIHADKHENNENQVKLSDTAPEVKKENEGKAANITENNIIIDIGAGVTLEMILIPAGTFQMGSHESEMYRADDEGPVHTVAISQDFYIGKYQVTQRQWKHIMGDNPSSFKKDDNYPVEHVSWDDCQKFIKKLNENAELMNTIPFDYGDFRLPTEAEWEYSCRAGTQTRFYWGDDPYRKEIEDYCWYNNLKPSTQPVGQKKPNEFGLYDMSGNVYEWCLDWYDNNYLLVAEPERKQSFISIIKTCLGINMEDNVGSDPIGVNSGSYRVIRGGSWDVIAPYCRSAGRLSYSPANKNNNIGLRLVLSPFQPVV